ncbi:hypothetical protein PoB_000985200 [Plakobranchus ocellatus]|uniref:Uncharacterized protein n=1 Tax=Plakobranchus ocellatus TaxID=259542 RepID=A0AAV3YMI3_9GAST|nr:hypothetical protein PoB_000985200 [Plakobranchus ocellatus]
MNIEKENFDTESDALERTSTELRTTHSNESFDGIEKDIHERELRRYRELRTRKRTSTAPRTTHSKKNFDGTKNYKPERELRRHRELCT